MHAQMCVCTRERAPPPTYTECFSAVAAYYFPSYTIQLPQHVC